MLEAEGLAEGETERERVGETMVLLVPAEGMTEAEALEAAEVVLAAAEEAEARTLETAEETAAEAEDIAEENEPDPPERENGPA